MLLYIIIILILVIIFYVILKFIYPNDSIQPDSNGLQLYSLSGGVIDRFHQENKFGTCFCMSYLQMMADSDSICNSIINNYTDDTDTNTIQLTFNSIDMNKNILYELVSKYKNKDTKYSSPNDFLIPVYFAYIITVFNNTHSEYIYEKLHLIFLVIITVHMYSLAFWEKNLYIQAKSIKKLLFSYDKYEDEFNRSWELYGELLKKLNHMTPSLKKMSLLEASEIFYNEFMLPYLKNVYMQNMVIIGSNIPVVPNTHIQYIVLGNNNINTITNKFKENDIFIILY